MIDDKLTQAVQAWLDTPAAERDVPAGALLLFKINKNRVLYANALARPAKLHDKIVYELKKHLAYRVDRKTLDDVVRMNRTVVPEAKELLREQPVIDSDQDVPEGVIAKGRRSDHDQLPDEIRQLWDQASNLYHKIKELFETLKSMEQAEPCDRYEYLKQLDEADKKYRACLQQYDAYGHEEVNPDAELVKKISAARKYLSENRQKLADLKDIDPEKYQALLAKVQQRYDFLIQSGNKVDPDQVTALAELGIIV